MCANASVRVCVRTHRRDTVSRGRPSVIYNDFNVSTNEKCRYLRKNNHGEKKSHLIYSTALRNDTVFIVEARATRVLHTH